MASEAPLTQSWDIMQLKIKVWHSTQSTDWHQPKNAVSNSMGQKPSEPTIHDIVVHLQMSFHGEERTYNTLGFSCPFVGLWLPNHYVCP